MHKHSTSKAIILIASMFVISGIAHAWYSYSPAYPSYWQPYTWPYSAQYTPGYYAHVTPRVYIRGRIDRDGDYWMHMHVSGLSRQDMYQAWLWYNYLKYQRRRLYE